MKVSDDIEAIVAHVKATRGLGNRATRRLVGRKLTPITLGVWRATGKFPVGFRHGSHRQPKPKGRRR